MASIGEKIRDARVQRGMTQSELSADLVTPSMISQIESDRTRPSYPLLLAIANRLSLPVEYFMNDMEDQYGSMAYVQLARCYLLFGQPTTALQVIQHVTRPDPPGLAYQEHQLVLVEALRLTEQFEPSVRVIEELREYALKNQDMYLLFSVCRHAGYVEYDIENFDGAMHEWETALSVGESLEIGGQFSTVQYQSALSEIYLQLHYVYQSRGLESAAKAALAKSVQLTQTSARLQSIADSMVHDGLHVLELKDASRAHDFFHRAALIAEAARCMERAICIEAEGHRSMSHTPEDPWTQVAVAATTVGPTGFLESELRTVRHLIENDDLAYAADRVERTLKLLDAYVQYQPTRLDELQIHRHRFLGAQAEVWYRQGRIERAMTSLSAVLQDLEHKELQEEWLRFAALMVQWKVDTEDFDHAVQLASRIQALYVQHQGKRRETRFHFGDFEPST